MALPPTGGSAALRVEVEGQREIIAKLRKVEPEAITELKADLKRAAEIVARDARARVPVGPPKHGHARDSIKAGATQKGAYVQGGKKTIPYYGWLDFGTREPVTMSGLRRKASIGNAHQTTKWERHRLNRAGFMGGGAGRWHGPWYLSGKGPAEGRFIYPAIRAHRDELVKAADKAFKRAKKKAGLA